MQDFKLDQHQTFEVHRSMFDVTSLHRPDTAWVFVDAQGHEHRWFVDGSPAKQYSPSLKYETPTLVWVKDGEEYWDGDDEPHDIGHKECRQCAEHIEPRFTADTCTQYVPGLTYYTINGESVSPDDFKRRYESAFNLHSRSDHI